MIRVFLLCFSFISCASLPTKPTLTLDEVFDYVNYPSINISPDGHNLIVHTRRALWDSNCYNNSLWLYETQTRKKTMITNQFSDSMKPKWSPNGDRFVFLLNEKVKVSNDTLNINFEIRQNIYIYCIKSLQLISIPIGTQIPLAVTWANDDSSLYVAMDGSNSTGMNKDIDIVEWKDVIRYRMAKTTDQSTIYHIAFDSENQLVNTRTSFVKVLPFKVNELLFSSSEQKLVFTSSKGVPTEMGNFEIYSIDLKNDGKLSKFTTNKAFEENLKLSTDGKHVLFILSGVRPINNTDIVTQLTLHAIDLATGTTQRLAKDFQGSITDYSIRPDGGVFILGQWSTNVQIYTQQSIDDNTVLHSAWQGTYESISSSLNSNSNVIAFVYSSHQRPKEVYIVNDINQLRIATAITNENELFTERNLPQTRNYQWKSNEDNRTIEGILHFPPGKFQSKSLPLLVLIHGGPYLGSTNQFHAGAGAWGSLAATDGWLVLEPNYRGSIGYGDQFLDEIRYHPLTRPAGDILSGISCLIEDGYVDPDRLTVGGYSYGGILTNWLITQTTQFNAALSGAGSVDQASLWGTMDISLLIDYLWGGYPWDSSEMYMKQSSIYHLAKVRTPTLIVTGANDIRVPPSQSYMLERALNYLNVPVQLLIFPQEGHLFRNNPWHGKIKVREELEWLRKYGHTNSMKS